MRKLIIIPVITLLFASGACDNKAVKDGYTLDYDDGKEIYVNVKIAIDKQGWESRTPEFFKTELKKQWDEINFRFNNSDRKKELKRHYVFKPDLDDIIIYEGCSYWGEDGADTKVVNRMDTTIFKLAVIYDFFYNGAENGEHGGGCGDYDGIGTILVINASEKMKDKYNDHFDRYTYRAITHELGHFRGVPDLYITVVEAENNPVNNEAFSSEHCLMNDHCYVPDEEARWSDYAVKIINKSGNRKVPGLIHKMMYDDFARKIRITAARDGKPLKAVVNLYPARYSFQTWSNTISETARYTFNVDGEYMINDVRDLFFNNPDGEYRHFILCLAEAVDEHGNKKYAWLANYMLHDRGLDGKDTYELAFGFD